MVEDDAELAAVGQQSVNGTEALHTCGVLECAVRADCGHFELALESLDGIGRFEAGRQLEKGIAGELRKANQLVRGESAAVRGERNGRAAGKAGGRDLAGRR